MLSVQNVSIKYADRTIVKNVSLLLKPGKVLVMLGPNGSGKTTIIRGITGVIPLSEGTIKFDESDLKHVSEIERAKIIGVVPQATQLPDDFSVYETVALGRTPHLGFMGRLSDTDHTIVEQAIQETAIEELRDKNLKSLSGGEQQRVILARAIAQDAPVMILDEPTSHLDLNYQLGMLSMVRNLSREKNIAVLMVLHDLNLAARFADEIVILEKGIVISSGDPAAVLTEPILTSVYKVPMSVSKMDSNPYPVIFPK